jgi:hypothetical protein
MITLPSEPLDGLNELYLQVKYQGDVARLYAGNVMLTDNFYNGQVWSVGLRRFMDSRNNSLELSVLPLRKDAPVYLELPEDLKFAPNGQIDRLDNLHLEPEYQLVLTDTGRQGNVRDLAPGGVSAAAGSTGVKEP